MTIRKVSSTHSQDFEALLELWVNAFGDSREEVIALFGNLSATGHVLEDDNIIVSCLTTYEAGTFDSKPVQVVYAVCTDPLFGNQGYASKLIKAVKSELESEGCVVITCPSTPELAGFYEKVGFCPFCYASEIEISANPEANNSQLKVKSIDYKEYAKYRKLFLEDCTHVIPDNKLIKQAQIFSVNSNGMLLINDGDAICIVDSGTDDEMFISELLVNPEIRNKSIDAAYQIAGGLAATFETSRVVCRTLAHIVYSDASGDYFTQGTYIQAMSGNPAQQEILFLPYFGIILE